MDVTSNRRVVKLADGVVLEVLGPGSKVSRRDDVEPKVIRQKGWLLMIDGTLMEKFGGAEEVLRAVGQAGNPELSYRKMNPGRGSLSLWQDQKTGQYCSLFSLESGAPNTTTQIGFRLNSLYRVGYG